MTTRRLGADQPEAKAHPYPQAAAARVAVAVATTLHRTQPPPYPAVRHAARAAGLVGAKNTANGTNPLAEI